MHSTYLLTWNPRKSNWINFSDDYAAIQSGFRPLCEWSCGNTKKIAIGDRVFLMRLGYREPIKGILASGWVTKPNIVDENWNDENASPFARYGKFELDTILMPGIDVLLDPRLVDSSFLWFPQTSGITIPIEVAGRLERAWHLHTQETPTSPQPTDEALHSKKYWEGEWREVLGHRYERDPQVRHICIQYYGAKCIICGFDFSKHYGYIGAGFIEVHHLKPISDLGFEREVDPIRDLRPVCPNCHAMLHRRSPPYSIEELKELRQQTHKV